jgi:hypothetical protein
MLALNACKHSQESLINSPLCSKQKIQTAQERHLHLAHTCPDTLHSGARCHGVQVRSRRLYFLGEEKNTLRVLRAFAVEKSNTAYSD